MVFLFLKKNLSDTDHGKYRFRAGKTLFLVILTVDFPKRDYFHFLEKMLCERVDFHCICIFKYGIFYNIFEIS